MVVASGMPPAPDMLSFEVSAGPPDAAPLEASADWTSGPAFWQPSQSAAAKSESSKRAEVRLTSHPRRAMLVRSHHNVRSSARNIIGGVSCEMFNAVLRYCYDAEVSTILCWPSLSAQGRTKT